VVIVGVGSGLAYAANGPTHHTCEELAFLRVLPHMTVLCPGDAWEVRLALRAALERRAPVYVRLGKKGEPKVHELPPAFAIGRGIVIRKGSDVCVISAGTILPVVILAAEELERTGVSAQVVSMPTLKPLDQDLLADAFARFSLVVTVEEHSILGGLGGSVAEWLADKPRRKAPLLRIGTADAFLHEAGEQEFAREYFGLTPREIARKTSRALLAIRGVSRGQRRRTSPPSRW
jgi:transketolase